MRGFGPGYADDLLPVKRYLYGECCCGHRAMSDTLVRPFPSRRELCALMGWQYNGDGDGLFERPFCDEDCPRRVLAQLVTNGVRWSDRTWKDHLDTRRGVAPYPLFVPVWPPHAWLPQDARKPRNP